MANLLVYIDYVDDAASWASLLTLRQARLLSNRLGATCYAVLPCATPPGYGEDDIIAALSRQGADKVILMTHPQLTAPPLFETHGEALLTAVTQFPPALLLMPEGPASSEIAPRVAARLGSLFYDHPRLTLDNRSNLIFTQPLFEGSHQRRISTEDLEHGVVAVVSPDAREFADPPGTEEAEVVVISPDFRSGTRIQSQPLATDAAAEVAPIRKERLIVAGAGADSQPGTTMEAIGQLAERLNADLRLSPGAAANGLNGTPPLAAVSPGCAPTLLMTFGVWGAEETLALLPKGSHFIAVHPDPKAPIFERADVAVVASVLDSTLAILSAAGEAPKRSGGPEDTMALDPTLPVDDAGADTIPPGVASAGQPVLPSEKSAPDDSLEDADTPRPGLEAAAPVDVATEEDTPRPDQVSADAPTEPVEVPPPATDLPSPDGEEGGA